MIANPSYYYFTFIKDSYSFKGNWNYFINITKITIISSSSFISSYIDFKNSIKVTYKVIIKGILAKNYMDLSFIIINHP